MKDESQKWVAKAEDDFRVAGRELANTDQPSYDAVCYHCQQSAEKYLKAFLTEHAIPFPYTHVLVDLLGLCLKANPEFETLRKDLEDLSVYGVQVRYPGFDAAVPAAKEAITAATRVRAFVRGKLGLDTSDADPNSEPE